jgi:hypothetical protein
LILNNILFPAAKKKKQKTWESKIKIQPSIAFMVNVLFLYKESKVHCII